MNESPSTCVCRGIKWVGKKMMREVGVGEVGQRNVYQYLPGSSSI